MASMAAAALGAAFAFAATAVHAQTNEGAVVGPAGQTRPAAAAMPAAGTADPDAAQVNTAAEEAAPFDILEFRVLGNTRLQPLEIERLVYPLLGPGKSIADVERARDSLVQAYRDKGYGAVFVDIPEQDVVNGIVRLKVTEGRLDRVRITGARYFANGRIRESLGSLKSGDVLSFTDFQNDLATLNRASRDRRVAPVLRAGRTPGTVDMELKVEDTLPVHGSVDVNDRYTANTTRTRVGVNLSYDNLFQEFHSLSLQYQTAPEEPKDARVIAATYAMPLGGSGKSLALYAVDTNSDVAAIGTLSVLGAGRIYGARYIAPINVPGSSWFHSLVGGLDFKDFEERIRLTDATDVSPIQYVNWSALYSASQRGERTNSSFGLSANFGIRHLANSGGPPPFAPPANSEDPPFFTPGEFGYKRSGASPNYFYLRGNVSHDRALFFGTRLAVRLSGQFTTEPLISNEQFSLGGAETVRGYLESTTLGDTGLAASLEIHTPNLARWQAIGPAHLDVFAFYDAGLVGIIDPLRYEDASRNQPSRVDLSSAGLGLRFSGFGGLDAALDWAYALEPTDDIARGDTRLHFQLTYGF
jgi:hemolysin activation/secretion protein